MKKKELNKVYSFLIELLSFKTIKDKNGNEFVLFSNNSLNFVEGIDDKTAFEAQENHLHLLDNISNKQFNKIIKIGEFFGKLVLCLLKESFPEKHFVVFTTVTKKDSFIIRFHQKWEGEKFYYDDTTSDENTIIQKFEN